MANMRVDGIQRLEPSVSGCDDGLGVGAPDEGSRALVVLGEEAVDGSLKVDDGAEDTVLQAPPGKLGAKKPSTALSQELEVGVKWKVQRGWRASHSLTLACLWSA